jgi:hypothetical protein
VHTVWDNHDIEVEAVRWHPDKVYKVGRQP